MSGPLQQLLAVQDLDLALDQLRHRKANLAERASLARLDGELSDLAGRLAEVEASRAELSERQRTTEGELAAAEERSAAVNRRLYGGDVSASRDLQAMSAELEHLNGRVSLLEDAVLEMLEEAEPLDARAGELELAREAARAERETVAGRLSEAESALDREVADAEEQRKQAAAAVAPGLLATYERLRGRLGGVGVARLVGNHCDGCHLTLSAMELDRVRHLPEGEVYTCEQCSRILVP